mmetsp:Transcript_109703/g.305757  ORF Transcript_109703/g.305757 Transcript_109703/m.305757 type:complete len:212 (+) Transcript_109703:128-763(+)
MISSISLLSTDESDSPESSSTFSLQPSLMMVALVGVSMSSFVSFSVASFAASSASHACTWQPGDPPVSPATAGAEEAATSALASGGGAGGAGPGAGGTKAQRSFMLRFGFSGVLKEAGSPWTAAAAANGTETPIAATSAARSKQALHFRCFPKQPGALRSAPSSEKLFAMNTDARSSMLSTNCRGAVAVSLVSRFMMTSSVFIGVPMLSML